MNVSFIEYVLKKCRKLFLEKFSYYGLSWIYMKNYSIIDQIFMKIIRIKNITFNKLENDSFKNNKIKNTYIDIVNYLIIALIKLYVKYNKVKISNLEYIINLYDNIIYKIKIKFYINKSKFVNYSTDNILNNILFLKKTFKKLSYYQLKKNYLDLLIKIIVFLKVKR